MLVLQQLFNLSDEDLEFQIIDRRSFEEFIRLGVMNSIKETLENQRLLRDNGSVIAGQNWVDGRQATGLLGLRDHHR